MMRGLPRSIAPASGGSLHYCIGKTVVITGATGFLGARLVYRLTSIPCQIVRVVRTVPRPLGGKTSATVIDVQGDVADRATWSTVVNDADVVLHCAAQTSGAVAAANPERDFTANVLPMRQLLDACRRLRHRPVVIFAGTVTEVGIPSRLPVDEQAPDRPVTIYDQHKLMAEYDLKAAARERMVCGATLRLANVYGPGNHAGSADRHILNRMIAAALRGQPLTVYGTGEYVRDYVFVEDVVDAFLMAVAHSERVNGHHHVIGSGRGTTIRQAFELVAARVEALTGIRVPIKTGESPLELSAVEHRHFVADSSRFSEATGWRATTSLSDGIDRTIEAYACG